MKYQILIKRHAAGEYINKDEISLLELELDSQLKSIKFFPIQVYSKQAPQQIF